MEFGEKLTKSLFLRESYCIVHQELLCGNTPKSEHDIKVVVSVMIFILLRKINHRKSPVSCSSLFIIGNRCCISGRTVPYRRKLPESKGQ